MNDFKTPQLMTSLSNIVSFDSQPVFDRLLAVNTTNLPKFDQYESLIAQRNAQQGSQIAIRKVREFGDCSSPAETGYSRAANVAIKHLAGLNAFSAFCQPPASDQQDVASVVESYLAQQGIVFRTGAYNLNFIDMLSDDTTTAVPDDIYAAMLPALIAAVDGHHLKTKPTVIDGVACMELIDIAHIMPVFGPEAFMNLVRQAALTVKNTHGGATYRTVPIFHQVHLTASTLSHPQSYPLEADEWERLELYAPDGLDQPLRPVDSALPEPEHFLCLPDNRTVPLAADLNGYLLNPARNARARAFYTIMNLLDQAAPAAALVGDWRRQRFEVVRPALRSVPLAANLKLAYLGFGPADDVPAEIGGVRLWNQTQDLTRFDEAEYWNRCSMRFDFGVKNADGSPHLEPPDGVIFGPFDPASRTQRNYIGGLRSYYGVWRQTETAAQRAAGVILNYRECHTDIDRAEDAYTTSGYTNNFMRRYGLAMPREVQHQPAYFADHLQGDQMTALWRGAAAVLRHRLAGYRRTPLNERAAWANANTENSGRFCIAPLLSASSVKRLPTEATKRLARFAAAHDMAAVWGGGPEGLMGAFAAAYRGAGGPSLGGISTFLLAVAESAAGCMGACDYQQLYPWLGPRSRDLIVKPDVKIGMSAGGIGTAGERYSDVTMQLLAPTTMQGKKLALVGDGIALSHEIRAMLGKNEQQRLLRTGYADAGLEIHYVPSVAALEPKLLAWQQEHNQRQGLTRQPLKRYAQKPNQYRAG